MRRNIIISVKEGAPKRVLCSFLPTSRQYNFFCILPTSHIYPSRLLNWRRRRRHGKECLLSAQQKKKKNLCSGPPLHLILQKQFRRITLEYGLFFVHVNIFLDLETPGRESEGGGGEEKRGRGSVIWHKEPFLCDQEGGKEPLFFNIDAHLLLPPHRDAGGAKALLVLSLSIQNVWASSSSSSYF